MTTATTLDTTAVEAFGERVLDAINGGALAMMLSIGHRTGLFDVMAGMAPASPAAIAEEAGLAERYVREWLGAMVTGGVVEVDPASGTYHLPAARITSHRLRTNTQSATAYRGFGGPQGVLGIERVMDHIAHTFGLDPLEVRKANYYSEMGGTPGVNVEEGIEAKGAGTSHKISSGTGGAKRFGGAHSPEPMEQGQQTTPSHHWHWGSWFRAHSSRKR